jgi:hypothetical protein
MIGLGIALRKLSYRFSSGVTRACALSCISIVLLFGTAHAQQPQANDQQTPPPPQQQEKPLPDAPGVNPPDADKPDATKQDTDKKDASPNPMEMAKTQILRARDWESGWIAGIYVGKNRKLVPLTGEERMDYYLRQTLTTPEAYLKRAFAALIDQARGTPYQWQGGIGGYGERFASREGQFIASNSLAALGNAKLGYEVRYDQCKCQGLLRRTRHAFIRNLVTYDRSEEHLHPQWALYGGAFAGGLISTSWKPGNHNPFAEGGEAMVEQIGWGTLLNFFTEFSREINQKQGVGR